MDRRYKTLLELRVNTDTGARFVRLFLLEDGAYWLGETGRGGMKVFGRTVAFAKYRAAASRLLTWQRRWLTTQENKARRAALAGAAQSAEGGEL